MGNRQSVAAPEGYVSLPEYARMKSLSESTVHSRCARSGLEYKRIGRRIFIKPEIEKVTKARYPEGYLGPLQYSNRHNISATTVRKMLWSGQLKGTWNGANWIIREDAVPDRIIPEGYISAPEFATKWGVKIGLVHSYISAGMLESIKIGSRRYVLPEELVKFARRAQA